MAITGTDRGTGTNGAGGTDVQFSPDGSFAAASFGVIVLAADNGGAGGSHNITGVTDAIGNTWTIRQSPLHDPGAPSAGVQGIIATTPMDNGRLLDTTTITVTFGNVNSVVRAWTIMEIIPTSGFRITYVTGGVGTGSATNSPTVTTDPITSGNMVIGALFNEQGTGQTVTQDGDTTNGAWSAQQTAERGTTAAGITVASQRKVVTGTGTQTYNPTLGVSSDVILAWIELSEVLAPSFPFARRERRVIPAY